MASSKNAKRVRHASKKDVPDASRSPNRTSDEAPMAEGAGRRTDIRDPLRAPGQLPPYARRKTHLEADESYGDTQIPYRKEDHSSAAKGTDGSKVERAVKRAPSDAVRKPPPRTGRE